MNFKISIGNIVKRFAIFIVLIVVSILFGILSKNFFTVDNFLTIIRQVSMVGISSVGMTFVILTGGIDLSAGSMITLLNIFCGYLMINVGWDPFPACALGVIMMTGVGLLQGMLITRINIPPFITTLAFMNILKGVAYLICKGMPIYGFVSSFSVLGQGYIGMIPVPVIVLVCFIALGSFILNKTYFGRYFYAIGGNEEAAKLSGMNVVNIKTLVYGLSGFFTGIAGVVMLSRLNTAQPTTGSGFEFEVITAVVLGGVSVSGGMGKMSGVIVGVLIMGILNNGMVLIGLGEYAQWVVKGIVLLLAVGFDAIEKKRAEIEAKERKMIVST